MAVQLTPREMEGIPDKWLEVILHFFAGFRNDTVDFGRPHLRPSIQRIYPLFMVLYAVLVICGTTCNIALLLSVFSFRRAPRREEGPRTVSGQSTRTSECGRERRRGRDPTLCFLANVAAADVVKCLVVLPVSLAVLLVQNWVFGSFMCFFLPMLQDIPIHVSMLSFVLIAADRHRLLMDPMKPRLPPLFCCFTAWLLALCIVLPYPLYTTYLDLGAFMKDQFEGVGICAVNLGDDMQEYMRGLFIAMYVLPLTVIAFLYVRVSRELKMLRERAEDNANGMPSLRPRDLPLAPRGETGVGVERRSSGWADEEVDVRKEQRTQKYLITMVVMFAMCLFPLMVLRLAKLALTETYENSGHFDIAFITFVWVAFLPTISTPCLYAAWTLSRPAKDRLRDYFRFGRRDEDDADLGEEERRCGAVLLGRRRRDVCRRQCTGLSNVALSFREGQCTVVDAPPTTDGS